MRKQAIDSKHDVSDLTKMSIAKDDQETAKLNQLHSYRFDYFIY